MVGLSVKNKIPRKIKAFSLFESVVAITIITSLIGIGSLIYGNLLKAERPVMYYQLQVEIGQHFEEVKRTKAYLNTIYQSEDYRIEQVVDRHPSNARLLKITYTGFVADKQLIQENHLVANEEFEQ